MRRRRRRCVRVVGGRWWVVGWLVFRTRDRVFPHSVWIVLSECIGVLSSVAKPLCRYRRGLCRLSATVDSGFFFCFRRRLEFFWTRSSRSAVGSEATVVIKQVTVHNY